MSIVSFGGPFLMLWALSGGEKPGWPPDRPFESIVIAVVLILFLALFVACLSIRLWFKPAPPRLESQNPNFVDDEIMKGSGAHPGGETRR
jgi:hypothetical protein